jgi:hypothetical protein
LKLDGSGYREKPLTIVRSEINQILDKQYKEPLQGGADSLELEGIADVKKKLLMIEK